MLALACVEDDSLLLVSLEEDGDVELGRGVERVHLDVGCRTGQLD